MNITSSSEGLSVRIIAVLVPLLFIGSGLLFGSQTLHWTFLLLVSIVLGYTHFFVATFYQIKGILRSSQRKKLSRYFFILCIVSALVSIVMIVNGHLLLLSVLSIAYFVVHVLANEHTYLSRIESFQMPFWSIISLVVPIGSLYLVALLHPSLFFSYDLLYYEIPPATQIDIIATYFPVNLLNQVALFSALLFSLVAPAILYFRHNLVTPALIYFGTGLAVVAIVATFDSLHFMYILHFVLVYHFTLLSLIFLKPMLAQGQKALNVYLAVHAIILIPLTLLGIMFMNQTAEYNWIDTIFQFEIFVVVSIVHITVSILNEPWFKRLFL